MNPFFLILTIILFFALELWGAECGPGSSPEKCVCEPGDIIVGNYTFPAETYTLGPTAGGSFVIGANDILIDASAATFLGTGEGMLKGMVYGSEYQGDYAGSGLSAFVNFGSFSKVTIIGGVYKHLVSVVAGNTTTISSVYGEYLAIPINEYGRATDSTFVHTKCALTNPSSTGNTFRYPINEADDRFSIYVRGVYARSVPGVGTVGQTATITVTLNGINPSITDFRATSSGGEALTIEEDGLNRLIHITPTKEGMYSIDVEVVDENENTFVNRYQLIVGKTVSRSIGPFYLRGSFVADPEANGLDIERPYNATNSLNLVPYNGLSRGVDDDKVLFSLIPPSVPERADCGKWIQGEMGIGTTLYGLLTSIDYSVMVASSATWGRIYLSKVGAFRSYMPQDNQTSLAELSTTPNRKEGTLSLITRTAFESYSDTNSLSIGINANDVVVLSPSTVKLNYLIPDYPRLLGTSDTGLIVTSALHDPDSTDCEFIITNPTNAPITGTINIEDSSGRWYLVSVDDEKPFRVSSFGGLISVPVTLDANATAKVSMKTIGFIVNEILVDKDFFVDAVIGDTSNTEIYVIENVEGSPNTEAHRAPSSLQSPDEPAGIQTRSILITPVPSARMSLDELLDVEITSLTGSFFAVDEILVVPQYMFVTFKTNRNELEDEILQAELTYSDRVETHTGIFPNLAFECRNVPDTNVWGDDHTSVPAISFWGMVLMGILLVHLGFFIHKQASKNIRNCSRPVGARPIN